MRSERFHRTNSSDRENTESDRQLDHSVLVVRTEIGSENLVLQIDQLKAGKDYFDR